MAKGDGLWRSRGGIGKELWGCGGVGRRGGRSWDVEEIGLRGDNGIEKCRQLHPVIIEDPFLIHVHVVCFRSAL